MLGETYLNTSQQTALNRIRNHHEDCPHRTDAKWVCYEAPRQVAYCAWCLSWFHSCNCGDCVRQVKKVCPTPPDDATIRSPM